MPNSKRSPRVSEKMLSRILEFAYQITKFAILAMLEPNEKKQDKFIEKIMEATEKIEEQYSSNWH